MAGEFVRGRWVASNGAVGRITEAKSSCLVVEVTRRQHRFDRPETRIEEWPRELCAVVPTSHIKNGEYCPPEWLRR